MYTMVYTKTNTTHVVGFATKYFSNLGKKHWNIMKLILIYLNSTFKMSLCFGNVKPGLTNYTDVNMIRDIDSRKSIFGYSITFSRELSCEN